jgi:hypothetical protein
MNNEFIRMQKLAGLITESEYKAKINEEYTLHLKNNHPNVNLDKKIKIDFEPTTMFGEWDEEELKQLFTQEKITSGTDIELTDSDGKVIKKGKIMGWEKDVPIISENQINEEENLSSEEQEIFDDIVNTLNEGMFNDVIEKIKSYAKKGLITTAIIASLLASPTFTQAQKNQISDFARTEMSQLPSTSKSEKNSVNINKLNQTKKTEDTRGSLNQALKSTNPYVINSKDIISDIPFTSWNYGASARKSNATAGLSLSIEKGSDIIEISISQVPGKSTTGYKAIVMAAKNLGGKVYQSDISTDISVSKDKISDVTSFVKNNINNLTK